MINPPLSVGVTESTEYEVPVVSNAALISVVWSAVKSWFFAVVLSTFNEVTVSPILYTLVLLSVPLSSYLTYSVSGVVEVAASVPITLALTPVSVPVIILLRKSDL